jgi:hypothetical protein
VIVVGLRKKMSSSARIARNLLMAETSPSRLGQGCAAPPPTIMASIMALATL